MMADYRTLNLMTCCLALSKSSDYELGVCLSYPFNNMLHHHVESIISLCLESNSQTLLDHLFKDCNFLTKLLTADENPYAPDTTPEVHCNLKVFEYFVQCLVKCFCLPLFGSFCGFLRKC
jgi:hypothetical protein